MTKISNRSKLQSQSKETTKPNALHSRTEGINPSPLAISMNHSKPEHQIHLNEEMWEDTPNLNLNRSLEIGKMDEHPSSIDGIQNEMSYLPKTLAVPEQYSIASDWKDHASNMSLKIEDEGRIFAELEENANANANSSLANESKKKDAKDVGGGGGDDDDENTVSSLDLLREATKECCSIKSDDCTSTADAESAEDDFFIHLFETTFDTESNSSFSLDLEGTDSEIQIAVNAIRKEAEKMDTMMVLDELKTLQTEFDSVTKKCSATYLENEDLKIQLQESEDKVAHMELERDLHQADATKLREDLKTIVSKMFDISMYESSESSNDKSNDKKKADHPQKDDCHLRSEIETSSTDKILFPGIPDAKTTLNTRGTAQSSQRMRIVGLVDEPRQVVRRRPLSSDPSLIHMFPRSQEGTAFWDTDNICLSPFSPENQHPRSQNVFRTRNNNKVVRARTKSIPMKHRKENSFSLDGRKNGIKNTNLRRHQSLSAIDTKSTILTTETKVEEEEKENRRCGILFRRRSKRQSFSREDVSIMKHQIESLHGLMKTSLGTSEKLRKRISTVTRYYEGVISKLHKKIADVKAEKSRTEVHLTNRISQLDLERRLVTSRFEHELTRKDREIARLKAERDPGEV